MTVPRPQPIRDAILAYLSEPRLAADIARHIARTVPTTTGHLAAMRRAGLVQRPALGIYAPPGPVSPELVARLKVRRKRICANHPLPKGQVHRALARARFPAAIASDIGQPVETVRLVLRRMWLSGVVTGDEASGYDLVAAGGRRRAAMHRALEALGQPRTVADLAAELGVSVTVARRRIAHLCASGEVQAENSGRYLRRGSAVGAVASEDPHSQARVLRSRQDGGRTHGTRDVADRGGDRHADPGEGRQAAGGRPARRAAVAAGT